ncbi:hypothetical protein, partial [Vibrio cholerae]|uniref:hypothetical protein n=1 Tax=Vibrio cholerae TaxID=666 RepID=UPI001F207F99
MSYQLRVSRKSNATPESYEIERFATVNSRIGADIEGRDTRRKCDRAYRHFRVPICTSVGPGFGCGATA